MRLNILKSALAGSAVLSVSLASAALSRTIYECQIEDRGTNQGWLPNIVVVAYEPGAETVTVSDPYIEFASGGPIEVKPTTDNDAQLSLKWKITLPAANQDDLNLTYSFTILKADNRAKISALPHGYDNTFTSKGTCKVKKG